MNLYYSNRCQFSKKIYDVINSNNLECKYICIDFSDEIPRNITSVPAIVFNNKLYVGKPAFELVKGIIDDKNKKGVRGGIEPIDCCGGGIGCDPYTYIDNDQLPMQDYYSFIAGEPTRSDAYADTQSTGGHTNNSAPSGHNLSTTGGESSSHVSKENLNEKQFDLSKLQAMRESDSGVHIKRVNFAGV